MLTQTGNNRESRLFRTLQDALRPSSVKYMSHNAILAKIATIIESDDFKKIRKYQQAWVKGYIAHALDSQWRDVQVGYHVNGAFVGCNEEKSSALLRALNSDCACAIWKETGFYYIEPNTYEFTFTEPES